MKKQLTVAIMLLFIGIFIGCGIMSVLCQAADKKCPLVKTDCKTENKPQSSPEETPKPTPEELPQIEKVLAIDDYIGTISLKPKNKEDMYKIIALSNLDYAVTEDIQGIMYSEREIDELITLYVINELFSIAYENNYDKIDEYQLERLSLKQETIEKLGKEIYKDYKVPNIVEGGYYNIREVLCKNNTCEFYWEIWGMVGPGGSRYISNTISEKKSGNNTIITVEILFLEIEIIENEEEVQESYTVRKRHDSTEKKEIGVLNKLEKFSYYKKHLSNTEKYQYTFDQQHRLIAIKRIN